MEIQLLRLRYVSCVSKGLRRQKKHITKASLPDAIVIEKEKVIPTKSQVLSVIPKEYFKKDTSKSLTYLYITMSILAANTTIFVSYFPTTLTYAPVWALYALMNGTIATGAWVLAHECGHGAFSDNKWLECVVGYTLHTLLLVPYFSWQRSHIIHHSKTNHIFEGESHVPPVEGENAGLFFEILDILLNENIFPVFHALIMFLFGWPLYLLFGASGGPVRGITNHFNPNSSLFPAVWKTRVLVSDIGILFVLAGLIYWGFAHGITSVLLIYVGPYLVTNAWLVLYTWLQHTDVYVPHLGPDKWTWTRGAFLTIDRPYGFVLNFLHHNIGSTHVAHHIAHMIPHYNAKAVTKILAKEFPELYLYDPTPIWKAVWRVSAKCVTVKQKKDGIYVFQL